MYTVSTKFLSTVRNSRKVRSAVDVYLNNTVVASNIPVVSGSVSVDRGSQIRRSGSLTVSSDTITPDLFEPIGTEIKVRSGFHYDSSGAGELVPLGMFRLQDLSWDDGDTKTLTMSFLDRSQALIDNLVDHTLDFSTANYDFWINYLLGYSFQGFGYTPALHINGGFNSLKRPPGGTTSDGNPQEIFQMFVDAMGGGEVYFDVDGNLQLAPSPTINSATSNSDAVWTVDVGEGGVLISAARKTSREGTYNRVAVYGATSETNARPWSRQTDFNTLSPSYFYGPFGKKVLVVENQTLTTTSQCQSVAREMLKNLTGLTRNVSFTSLYNPALDVGDIVLFKFLDGTTALHMIDSLSLSLSSGEMSGETRTAQFVI